QVGADIAKLLGSEQHDHNRQDDEQLPNTYSTNTHYCLQVVYLIRLLARCLFYQPRNIESFLQFRQHVVRAKVQMAQHDQAVEPQVSGFLDQRLRVAGAADILGGDDRLSRFFADFFQNLVEAFAVQAGDIGVRGVCLPALFQDSAQLGQNVTHGHVRVVHRSVGDP